MTTMGTVTLVYLLRNSLSCVFWCREPDKWPHISSSFGSWDLAGIPKTPVWWCVSCLFLRAPDCLLFIKLYSWPGMVSVRNMTRTLQVPLVVACQHPLHRRRPP